jgi:uncharacterized protein YegP (UPF0339 family)
MNARIARIGSPVDNEGSRTDWARLRALTDAEIETAIAGDPDSYELRESDLLGRSGASFRYEVYEDKGQEWRWRLLSANGEVLALGAQAYPSRDDVETAIVALRDALLGARSKAA